MCQVLGQDHKHLNAEELIITPNLRSATSAPWSGRSNKKWFRRGRFSSGEALERCI